jgi:hypothetical protein
MIAFSCLNDIFSLSCRKKPMVPSPSFCLLCCQQLKESQRRLSHSLSLSLPKWVSGRDMGRVSWYVHVGVCKVSLHVLLTLYSTTVGGKRHIYDKQKLYHVLCFKKVHFLTVVIILRQGFMPGGLFSATKLTGLFCHDRSAHFRKKKFL